MSSDATKSEDGVGYRRPPAAARFQKGKSGNPRGRPRGRRKDVPHDAVLGQMVTVREVGRERRITAAEAFLLQLVRKGLAGDSAAARASLAAIEGARAKQPDHAVKEVITVVLVGMANDTAPVRLGILHKKHANDEQLVQCELQPWIVEAALARFGSRRLTEAEQQEVWNNTRTPHKVAWPDWWTVKSGGHPHPPNLYRPSL
jgi:hypothetical protein